MSHADTSRVLSGLSCGVQSLCSYLGQKEAGVRTPYALANLFGNLSNGLARNEIAYMMERHGNPLGTTLNSLVGYGNPVSNMAGTLGLVSMSNPWLFFNGYCGMMPMMPMMMPMNPLMYGGSISIHSSVSYRC